MPMIARKEQLLFELASLVYSPSMPPGPSAYLSAMCEASIENIEQEIERQKAKRTKTYSIPPNKRIRIDTVQINGRTLSPDEWTYDEKSGTVTIKDYSAW